MLKTVLTMFLSVCVFSMHAQTIKPQSVNSAGGKMNQSSGSLSFTVCDLLIFPYKDSVGTTLSNGFSSSSTLTALSIIKLQNESKEFLVFPNPVKDVVNIQFMQPSTEKVDIEIVDFSGRKVYNGRFTVFTQLVNFNASILSSGTYVLSVRATDSKLLGNYIILKQ